MILMDGVRAAAMAPSLHNSQPWRFRIVANTIEVYADPERRLSVLDPAGRELLISVGAAVFTLRVALREHGVMTLSTLFPEPRRPDLVARIYAVHHAAPTAACEALAAAIPHRHTNRWPFANLAVPADALEQLISAAGWEGVRLRVAGATERDAILGLAQLAESMLHERPGYAEELSHWRIPPAARGPADALGIMPTRDFGPPRPADPPRPAGPPCPAGSAGEGGARLSRSFEPHPTILVLSTEGDTPADQVRAGQALQRVLLTATWLDLATAPISQPIEIPEIRARLGGGYPQMVLRVGYGQPVGATPRRDVTDTLISGR
ncbi:nitroreductase [Actinoplanes sp. NPDC051851]|uniref:Acg family FMN-binding oxidoreductase n=1 Tax=Actinoplanes sp. NPDC051851 TaxID=3154753 RepID=UPI0034460DAB